MLRVEGDPAPGAAQPSRWEAAQLQLGGGAAPQLEALPPAGGPPPAAGEGPGVRVLERGQRGARIEEAAAPARRSLPPERLETALRELKTRLKFSESRARGAAEERDALRRRLLVETARAEEAAEEALRLREANQEQSRAVRLLEEQLRATSLALEETLAGTSETEGRLGGRLRRKERQLEEAMERGRGREELIRHLEGQLASSRRRVAVTEQRGEHLDAVNADLSRELVASKQELQKLFSSRLAHLKTIDASEQAVRDNARLIKILRSASNVCKPLGDLLDDWDDSGGAAYIAGSVGGGGGGGGGGAGSNSEADAPQVGSEVFAALEAHYASVVVDDPHEVGRVRIEALKWAPAEAQEEVQEFWRRLGSTLPWQPFAELLHRLDKVWREREHRKLVRVTTAYQRKVQELRARLKRMAGRVGAETADPRSEVDRLRRMLHGSPRSGKAQGSPQRRGDPALHTALKTVERLSQQLSAVLEDNEELRRESERGLAGAPEGAAVVEEAARAGLGGDIYFAKGAAWQGGRDAAVLEELAGRVAAIRAQVPPRVIEVPGPLHRPGQPAGGAAWTPLDSLDRVEEAVEVARQKIQRRVAFPASHGGAATGQPTSFPPTQQFGVDEELPRGLTSPEENADTWAGGGGGGVEGSETRRLSTRNGFYPLLSSDEEGDADSGDDAQEWSKSVLRVRRGGLS